MSPTTTSPLRVAVEGVPFEPNWFFGGVSLYMREVLRLFAHDPSVSFHVFAKELHPEATSFLDDLGIPFSIVPRGSMVWRARALRHLKSSVGIQLAWFPFHVVPFTSPVPVTFTLHDFAFLKRHVTGSWIHRLYYLFMFLRAASLARSFLCISHATFADLQTYFPWWCSKVHIAPHGIPSDALAFKPQAGTNISEKPRVLFLDGGNPRKRLDLLAKCLQDPEFANWELAITGDPSDILTRLRNCEASLPKNTTFLGRLSRCDLLNQIHDSTVLAYLSDFEGFGFPILEALALKTPVVSFAGLAEKEAGGAWITYCEEPNPEKLKSCLKQAALLKGSSSMQRFSEAAVQNRLWDASKVAHQSAWHSALEAHKKY